MTRKTNFLGDQNKTGLPLSRKNGDPDYAFAVVFPGTPQVEATTYQIVHNRSVPARVRRSDVVFKMMVAELVLYSLPSAIHQLEPFRGFFIALAANRGLFRIPRSCGG